MGNERAEPRSSVSFDIGIVALVGAAILALIGCSSTAANSPRSTLITSVNPLGSIIRNVVGNRYDVISLVSAKEIAAGQPSIPAQYEVSALVSSASAALFFGTFDHLLAEAISETAQSSFRTLLLSDELDGIDFGWVNPLKARALASQIATIAKSLSPSDDRYFDQKLEEFNRALDRIDLVISETASSVSPEMRKIAATTESMRPFFERYGFAYFSLESEGGVGGLAFKMREQRIRAIYVNSFGSDKGTVEALKVLHDSEATLQGTLFDARLPGPVGSLFHTYFGLLIENARQALGPLGADTSKLDSLHPVDIQP